MATQTRWFLELSRVTKSSAASIINISKQMKKDINNFSEQIPSDLENILYDQIDTIVENSQKETEILERIEKNTRQKSWESKIFDWILQDIVGRTIGFLIGAFGVYLYLRYILGLPI